MTQASANLTSATVPPSEEARIVLYGVSWSAYEGILRELGDDHPALRLTYLEGTLEITTTSRRHEFLKKIIARLLEAWAEETGLRFDGYGGATFRRAEAARGLEPDECYALGELGDSDAPDLAIEVVESRGVVNKLDVCRSRRARGLVVRGGAADRARARRREV
jgi:Uma2 family endonuclease